MIGRRTREDEPLPAGNFSDFASLFKQLESTPVFELGKPAPEEKYLPRKVGSCPAAHNRALFGDGDQERSGATNSQIEKARSPAAGGS